MANNLFSVKRIYRLLPLFLLIAVGISIQACKKKSQKLTPSCNGGTATYNSNVKAIINAQCVSCHSGYSSYAGLSGILNNGQFKQAVLVDQSMPQSSQLSQDQINTLECWSEASFPEN